MSAQQQARGVLTPSTIEVIIGYPTPLRQALPEITSMRQQATQAKFVNLSCAVWRTKRSTEKSRFRASDGCRGPKGRGSRCEAARAAIRFGGHVREDVLKCTIAPGFRPKGGPEVGLISLFFPSLSLSLSPSPPSPPASPHCGATQGPGQL